MSRLPRHGIGKSSRSIGRDVYWNRADWKSLEAVRFLKLIKMPSRFVFLQIAQAVQGAGGIPQLNDDDVLVATEL